MKTFKLTRETLYKIWVIDTHTVEAETEEEALELVKNEESDSVDCNILWETSEIVEPTNIPTDIISNEDGKVIWANQ